MSISMMAHGVQKRPLSPVQVMPTNPRGASNGTGYCVSWVQDDGTADSAYANTFDGSTWGTEQVLESSDTEVNYDWERWTNVVAAQDTYTIGWLQEDVNDPLM